MRISHAKKPPPEGDGSYFLESQVREDQIGGV